MAFLCVCFLFPSKTEANTLMCYTIHVLETAVSLIAALIEPLIAWLWAALHDWILHVS